MTKEEIVNAVMTLDIIEIYTKDDKLAFSKSRIEYSDAVLSVTPKAIMVTYYGEDMKFACDLIPFNRIKRIVGLIEKVLE